MRARSLPPLLAAVAILAVGCGGDEEAGEPAGATEDVAATQAKAEEERDRGGGGDAEPAKPGTTITTAESQFGTILFDSDDRAIYLFDKETSQRSECYGACAEAWPPVLTEGEPEATGDAKAKLLGTTERDDGSLQVTYAGRPLYYYVDEPRGEVLCHNVDEFGGLWLVVEPGGDPVA